MSQKSSKFSPLLAASCVSVALMSLALGLGLNSLQSSREFIVADMGWCANDQKVYECRHSLLLFRMVGLGVFLGAAIGSVIITFSHKVSRRLAMMVTSVFYVVASLISGFAVNYTMIFVGRMLFGFAFGMTSVTLLFLIEICHPRWRSWFTFQFQFFASTGYLVSSLWQLMHGRIVEDTGFQVTMMDKVVWRGAQLLPGLCALIAFVLLFFVSKRTPYELIERGMTDESLVVIKKLYSNLGEDLENNCEKSNTGANKTHVSVDTTQGLSFSHELCHNDDPVHEMFSEFLSDAESAKERPNIFIFEALYMKGYLKPICFVFVLACAHQLAGPTFFNETAPMVFAEALGRSYNTTLVLFCLALINFLATVLVAFSLKKLGRRTLMLAGTAVSIVFMFFALFMRDLGNNAKWAHGLTILGYFGYTAGYAFGLGAVTCLYLAEVFPTQIRNTGLAFCMFASWTCARILLFGIEYLFDSSPMVFYLIIFFLSILSFLHVFLFVRETKDLPLGTAYHGGGILAFSLKRA